MSESKLPSVADVMGWSREECINWLVWCDSNGCFTDEDCRAEGWKPMTLADARHSIFQILTDSATPEELLLLNVEAMAIMLAMGIEGI